ncbi:DUF6538 domain-containing protein [Microvirga sp. 2MCAF38]|uniref:DUF6538 domain-containing protein n=1 Tax=Microvirga sp. 2MCAF38 TaxID=3232989 RepID=UPI003F979160
MLIRKIIQVNQRLRAARVVHTGSTHGPFDVASLEASQDRNLLLRKGVPDDLRSIIGKREIKLSLKTSPRNPLD